MKDIESGLNPFASENLPVFLYVLIIMGVLLVITFSIEKFIIPRLNPDNRFLKFWKKYIIDEDPFHL
jgi:hypothetical protein